MTGRIVTDAGQCSGCRLCEISCSLKNEGVINSRKARLKVIYRAFPELSRRLVVCQQCKIAACAKACPTNSFIKDGKTGILVINKESCTGCMDCVEACPFGALFAHPDKKAPLKCDLCSGEPACVKNCPSEALKYELSTLLHAKK